MWYGDGLRKILFLNGSPEWVARMAQLTPQERLEAFSRKPEA